MEVKVDLLSRNSKQTVETTTKQHIARNNSTRMTTLIS